MVTSSTRTPVGGEAEGCCFASGVSPEHAEKRTTVHNKGGRNERSWRCRRILKPLAVDDPHGELQTRGTDELIVQRFGEVGLGLSKRGFIS